MANLLTIDIEKAKEQAAYHETEAVKWREFIDRAAKVAASPKPATGAIRKPGRPRKNEVRDQLVEFISKQDGDFTNADIRTALSTHNTPKHKLRAAIQEMIADGKLQELKKPAGARPGLYRSIDVGQKSQHAA
jgi:hypothetical protein